MSTLSHPIGAQRVSAHALYLAQRLQVLWHPFLKVWLLVAGSLSLQKSRS